MPFTISRLRRWFAVLALATVAVVAGFYVRARLEMRRAWHDLPGKVGINIQQTSEGFTLSKSEGGRTLFTIHAAKATQFKQGGRAELHDVRIVVFGRRSDRYDQIYGSDFEYDPSQAQVVSRGEVGIDLESAAEAKAAAGTPPGADPNPTPGKTAPLKPQVALHGAPKADAPTVHLRVEGLVFDQKTGVAASDGRVEFRLPQAAGSARGATYDSKQNVLTLRSEIDVQTEGREPSHIVAGSGSIGFGSKGGGSRSAESKSQERELTLQAVRITGGGRTLWADKVVAPLSADNTAQKVEATGNVRLNDRDGLQLRAPKGELLLAGTRGSQNAIQSAWLGGGVEFVLAQQGAEGHAGEIRMAFAPRDANSGKAGLGKAKMASGGSAAPQTVYASQGAVLRQAPRAGSRNPQALTMTSDAMTFGLAGQGAQGQRLSWAQTEGPGELTIAAVSGSPANEAGGAGIGSAQTVIDARRFTAEFGEGNRLRAMHGVGAVRVRSRAAGEPERISTSETLVAEFNPSGDISRVLQEGGFQYREGQSSKGEPGGRSAAAARASYSPLDDSLTLAGEPRIVDGGTTVEADGVRLLRKTGELFASGHVKTTYSQLAVQSNGALLATGDPVHVTAQAMNALRGAGASGLAHYTGGARLWQGSNVVQAQSIDFDAQARTIAATGDAQRPVTSVFLQVDAKGKATTVLVTAPKLNYEDKERQAHYSGGVTAKGEDGVMTAGRADIFLNPAGANSGGAAGRAAGSVLPIAGPSQLEKIVASTHVVVQQGARRAQGEKLVFDAAKGTYVMTGGPPMLSDPVNGTVRGDSLTFYSRDDRVVVEGGDSSRAVTHTHISR